MDGVRCNGDFECSDRFTEEDSGGLCMCIGDAVQRGVEGCYVCLEGSLEEGGWELEGRD